MITKFNVGDTVLIKGVVETIYVGTTDNEPIYYVRLRGVNGVYGLRVKEADVMRTVQNE